MTDKTEKVARRGVGTVAKEAIAAGKSNEDALAAVQAEFPEGKTSLQTISWYRNDMRKKDPTIPSGRSSKKPAATPPQVAGADPLA